MSRIHKPMKRMGRRPLPMGGRKPAAGGAGGAVSTWWDARIAALTPDPYWDDVALLMQVHPDDADQERNQDSGSSFTTDRKDSSVTYAIERHTTRSATKTSTGFADFVADEDEEGTRLPLGCGWLKNQYGFLNTVGKTLSDLDPESGDWTMEVVIAQNWKAIQNAGGSAPGVWCAMDSSNGYKWNLSNNSWGKLNAFGVQYVSDVGGGIHVGTCALTDANGDNSAGWDPATHGVKNITVFYDQSAGHCCMAVDGILMPTYHTTADWSGFVPGNTTNFTFGSRVDSPGNMAASNPIYQYWCAARLTFADRYGLSGNMANYGLPAFFAPPQIFAERGE